jgi:hypothetical protein
MKLINTQTEQVMEFDTAEAGENFLANVEDAGTWTELTDEAATEVPDSGEGSGEVPVNSGETETTATAATETATDAGQAQDAGQAEDTAN